MLKIMYKPKDERSLLIHGVNNDPSCTTNSIQHTPRIKIVCYTFLRLHYWLGCVLLTKENVNQ